MKAIAENIISLWNMGSSAAGRCMKAANRECKGIVKRWAEMEAYWVLHPEIRPQPCLNSFYF